MAPPVARRVQLDGSALRALPQRKAPVPALRAVSALPAPPRRKAPVRVLLEGSAQKDLLLPKVKGRARKDFTAPGAPLRNKVADLASTTVRCAGVMMSPPH